MKKEHMTIVKVAEIIVAIIKKPLIIRVLVLMPFVVCSETLLTAI